MSNPEKMPQNVSLLGQWSSLGLRGREVSIPEIEPQNVSLWVKWSSLGIEGTRSVQPRNRASKCVTFGQMVQIYQSAKFGEAISLGTS